MSPTRQAICILGMHRSGTSALAGVVHSLGATAPKTLLTPQLDNPFGFWECARLVQAHDTMLASVGSNWHDWRRLNPRGIHLKAAKQDHLRIKEILMEEFGDEPLFFIKDPRICRFSPFMFSILEEMKVSSVAFLPLRNPLEVAYSLRRRNGFSIPKSLLLWLRHVLDAEYDTRSIPRYFLTFENLLMDWRYQMDRAAEQLGVIWPIRSDSSDANQLLMKDLHHEKCSLQSMQAHPDVSHLVVETYEILRTISANGESTNLIDRLDVLRTKFDEGCSIFGSATAIEELVSQHLSALLVQQTTETERLRASMNQQRIEAEQLSVDNECLIADLQAAAKQLEEFRVKLAQREADQTAIDGTQ